MFRVLLQPQLLRLLARHQASLVAVCLAAAAMTLVSTSDLQDDLDLGVCSPNLIRRHFQIAYRCQPDEFVEATTCGRSKKVIDCPTGRYLAVHSASRGRSRSSTECSRMELTNETDCRVHCVVREVETMCLGRHRCQLSANDESFDDECPMSTPAHPTNPSMLRVRYTCVRKSVAEEVKRDHSRPTSWVSDNVDDPCPERVGYSASPPLSVRRRGQVTHLPTSSNNNNNNNKNNNNNNNRSVIHDPLSSTSIAMETKQTTKMWTAIKTRDGFLSTPSSSSAVDAISTAPIGAKTATPVLHDTGSRDGAPIDSVSVLMQPGENSPPPAALPSVLLRSMSDWLWTCIFVKDNVEKSILYLLCSFCFGIILLLIVVIINLACLRRTPSRSTNKIVHAEPIRLANSDNSVKWQSPESESSTGDDRPFQGDEDVDGGGHPHHHHPHNHHPHQGYSSWHHRASNPSSPSAPVNAQSPPAGALDGADGTPLMMKSRRVSEGETLPTQQQGTQSLPRRPAPLLWYHQDAGAGDESPVAVAGAQTLQPTRPYNNR